MEIDRCDIESLIAAVVYNSSGHCRAKFRAIASLKYLPTRRNRVLSDRDAVIDVSSVPILIISDRHATRQPSVNETRVVADIDPTPIDVSRPVLPLHAHQFTSARQKLPKPSKMRPVTISIYTTPLPSIRRLRTGCACVSSSLSSSFFLFLFPLLFFPPRVGGTLVGCFSYARWIADSKTRRERGERGDSGRVMNGKYV